MTEIMRPRRLIIALLLLAAALLMAFPAFAQKSEDTIRIGMAWDIQEVPELPVEPHDMCLTAVVTPTRVLGPFDEYAGDQISGDARTAYIQVQFDGQVTDVTPESLEAVEATSQSRGYDYTDLALLTDGLRSEREQGITIDVAYRYFATPSRKFIIADTPGHVQYTRNMVTGASTADLALVLVDARKGVIEQTRRHAALSALLPAEEMRQLVAFGTGAAASDDLTSTVPERFAAQAAPARYPGGTDS